ncbi:MAG: DNA topoisomerase IB [Acidimicrobiia bacterium]
MARLRRADCSVPGITRRKAGKGFYYLDATTGERIRDEDTLARIASLVLPPAWTDVWICPWPNGHIQATGFDARGRRQYRYHDRWRERRDSEKFDKMLDFARALPGMRCTLEEHLALADMPQQKVLACATRLLDLGFFRIGSEGYAEENDTFGLATMRKKHARVDGDVVTFDYTAKGGKRRVQSVVDPAVRDIVTELKSRRAGGSELLAWRDDAGVWHDVKSVDINTYVKAVTGGDYTAKDFRTWNATVLAAVALAVSFQANGTKTSRTRAEARAMQEVAAYLGNTPAVARSSYVDPRVIDRFRAGQTIVPAIERLAAEEEPGGLSVHGEIEAAVLELLSDGEVTATADEFDDAVLLDQPAA